MVTTSNSQRVRRASKDKTEAPSEEAALVTTDADMTVAPAEEPLSADGVLTGCNPDVGPDSDAGRGGLYRIDPATGKRVLVTRMQPSCC